MSTRPTSLRRTWIRLTGMALIAGHLALVVWSIYSHTPARDEVGHLAAGLSHWTFGEFDCYKVNPPLVRMMATVPVVLMQPQTDWRALPQIFPGDRSEWLLGRAFIAANGRDALNSFFVARLACLPWTLLGAWCCWTWAEELYGTASGLAALALWCFSPNIIAHASLITPDLAATSLGVCFCYALWQWLRSLGSRPDCATGSSLLLGLVAGALLLTKATWLVLLPLTYVIYVAAFAGLQGLPPAVLVRSTLVMGGTALFVMNLGYGFTDVGRPLGKFQFVSRTLAGDSLKTFNPGPDLNATHSDHSPSVVNSQADSAPAAAMRAGNRFRGHFLAGAPIPFPAPFVEGIDLQKRDFEQNLPCYLRGSYIPHGVWYYYLYAILIKESLGTLLLCAASLLLLTSRLQAGSPAINEVCLLTSAALVIGFVSSQTGLCRHLRYVLPAFPCLFIWASGALFTNAKQPSSRLRQVACTALTSWTIIGSICVCPHFLSHFNELVGGSLNGHRHLLGSNVEWDQDLLFVADWARRHPEASNLQLLYRGLFDERLLGLNERSSAFDGPERPTAPAVADGWYAVNVNELHRPDGRCSAFLKLSPVDRVAHSYFIYHVASQSATAH